MPNHPNASLRTFLSFDYGLARIGVAYGQTITCSTRTLPHLKANEGQPNWDQVAALVREWQPDAFIVGLPLNMDGSESDMSDRATKFALKLHGRFHKPYFMVDERLSSHEARTQLGTTEKTAKADKKRIDGIAAEMILTTFFNDRQTQATSQLAPNSDKT